MKIILKAILGFFGRSFTKAAENVMATIIISAATLFGGGLYVNEVVLDKKSDATSGNGTGANPIGVEQPLAAPVEKEKESTKTALFSSPKEVPIPVKADPFLAYLDKTRKKSGAKRSCAFLILKNSSRTNELNGSISTAINNAGFQPKASFFKGDLGQYLDDFKFANEQVISESGVTEYIDCYLIGEYSETIEPHFERQNEKTIRVNFKGQIVDLNSLNTTPFEFDDIYSGKLPEALSKAYAGISGEIGGRLTAIN